MSIGAFTQMCLYYKKRPQNRVTFVCKSRITPTKVPNTDELPITQFFFMSSEHGPRKHNFRRPSTKWATETKNRGPSELPITQFFFMRSEHGPRKHSFRRPITIWATKTKIVAQVSFAQRLRGAKCRGPSTKWATKTKNRGPNQLCVWFGRRKLSWP